MKIKNNSTYDFKKLVDTEPISNISFEDTFPIILSVFEKEQIELFKVNMGGKFMTTNWIKIQDGKLGSELQGLLTFYYHENKIWPYYIQKTGSNGKNSQCLSKACKELKVSLSNKIMEAYKTENLEALRSAFYTNQKVNDAILNNESTTTLSKKLWKSMNSTSN